MPNLIFYVFCFRITSPYGTDGQTDGRTDGQARRVMQLIGRPHNKVLAALVEKVPKNATNRLRAVIEKSSCHRIF